MTCQNAGLDVTIHKTYYDVRRACAIANWTDVCTGFLFGNLCLLGNLYTNGTSKVNH